VASPPRGRLNSIRAATVWMGRPACRQRVISGPDACQQLSWLCHPSFKPARGQAAGHRGRPLSLTLDSAEPGVLGRGISREPVGIDRTASGRVCTCGAWLVPPTDGTARMFARPGIPRRRPAVDAASRRVHAACPRRGRPAHAASQGAARSKALAFPRGENHRGGLCGAAGPRCGVHDHHSTSRPLARERGRWKIETAGWRAELASVNARSKCAQPSWPTWPDEWKTRQ
jgi:hypothetical protein